MTEQDPKVPQLPVVGHVGWSPDFGADFTGSDYYWDRMQRDLEEIERDLYDAPARLRPEVPLCPPTEHRNVSVTFCSKCGLVEGLERDVDG